MLISSLDTGGKLNERKTFSSSPWRLFNLRQRDSQRFIVIVFNSITNQCFHYQNKVFFENSVRFCNNSVNTFVQRHWQIIKKNVSRYSRMGQVKFVEDSL